MNLSEWGGQAWLWLLSLLCWPDDNFNTNQNAFFKNLVNNNI